MDPSLFLKLMNTRPHEHQKLLRHLAKRPEPEAQILSREPTTMHLAKKVMEEGSGFVKVLKSTLNLLNPVAHFKTAKQILFNLKQRGKMNSAEKTFAKMAQDSYLEVGSRKGESEGIDGWKINSQFSNKRHVVYSRGNNHTFVLRGTADTADLMPDLGIIAGTSDKSPAFIEARKQFEAAQKALGGIWNTTGHSLGGTKAMFLAQNSGGLVSSYAFNPGFHSFADDRIDTKYDKHHVFTIQGDPVSNSILTRDLAHLKVSDAASFNPLKNHSMSNFVEEPQIGGGLILPARKSARREGLVFSGRIPGGGLVFGNLDSRMALRIS